MISAAGFFVTDPVIMMTGRFGAMRLICGQSVHAAHPGHQLIQKHDVEFVLGLFLIALKSFVAGFGA